MALSPEPGYGREEYPHFRYWVFITLLSDSVPPLKISIFVRDFYGPGIANRPVVASYELVRLTTSRDS